MLLLCNERKEQKGHDEVRENERRLGKASKRNAHKQAFTIFPNIIISLYRYGIWNIYNIQVYEIYTFPSLLYSFYVFIYRQLKWNKYYFWCFIFPLVLLHFTVNYHYFFIEIGILPHLLRPIPVWFRNTIVNGNKIDVC